MGLDRKIYEGRAIDSRFRNKRLWGYPKKRRFFEGSGGSSAIDSSLEDVQYLVFEYFRKVAFEQPKISEEFKKKIFHLSFKFNEDKNIETIPKNADGILDKKNQVLKAIENLDIRFLDFSAKEFFNKMEDLINANEEVKKEDLDQKEKDQLSFDLLMKWINNSSQMKRVEEIISFSQTYQEKIIELRAPIKRLEKITSNFLREGKKQIQVADDGELKVKLSNGTLTNVFELSSGEKQIVIMIAHLIFEEDQKPSGVFIIDEPELSLHIAWQEIFVSSITEASPNTQFILATHSPVIIGDTDEKLCQDLAELN
ncbi:MAG: ATP-binding protein [Sphingobacteriaceae bacterium]|nr:ATP-binding protein [Sphingobacteriaceae bacterium]